MTELDTVIRLDTAVLHVASREASLATTELFVRLERSCRVAEGLSRQHTAALVKDLGLLHKQLFDGGREFDLGKAPAMEHILIDLLTNSPSCRFRCASCDSEFGTCPQVVGFLRPAEDEPRMQIGGRSLRCWECNAVLFEFIEKLLFSYDPSSMHPI